jgi:hypothetical protein
VTDKRAFDIYHREGIGGGLEVGVDVGAEVGAEVGVEVGVMLREGAVAAVSYGGGGSIGK